MNNESQMLVNNIINNIQSKTFKILKTARGDKGNPIVIFECKENVFELAKEIMVKHDVPSEFIDSFFRHEYLHQLEALGRIFILDENLKYKSVLFNKRVFGSGFSEIILKDIEEFIVNMASSYIPYNCGGISYGSHVYDDCIGFKVTLTKFNAPVEYGSVIHGILTDMFTAMDSTDELKILLHIYENEVGSFTRKKKRNKFIKQMETILNLKNSHSTLSAEEVYRIYWSNPWITNFMVTGLWAGMSKLLKASAGNHHTAKNSFITLYDRAV